MTLADPRIWPLKLTRVIAAFGGMTAGAAAGLLIEQDARIGPWTCAKSAELLVELHTRLQGSELASEAVSKVVHAYLSEHHFVWGFGTPFRQADERLVAFSACLERRGLRHLPYQRTLDAIAQVITSARQTEPNMGMGIAAAFLDLGVEVREVGPLATALMQHMFFAHAVEGARQAPAELQRLPTEYIRYAGRAARSSPRALASGSFAPPAPREQAEDEKATLI